MQELPCTISFLCLPLRCIVFHHPEFAEQKRRIHIGTDPWLQAVIKIQSTLPDLRIKKEIVHFGYAIGYFTQAQIVCGNEARSLQFDQALQQLL